MVSSGFPGVSQTLTLLVHSRYIDDHNTHGAYAAATLLMMIALVILLWNQGRGGIYEFQQIATQAIDSPYVVFAQPPKKAPTIEPTPSPSSVLSRPGSHISKP